MEDMTQKPQQEGVGAHVWRKKEKAWCIDRSNLKIPYFPFRRRMTICVYYSALQPFVTTPPHLIRYQLPLFTVIISPEITSPEHLSPHIQLIQEGGEVRLN